MRRSRTATKCPRARHYPAREALVSGARGGLLLFLAGAIAALAGPPANLDEALSAQRSLVASHPTDTDLLNDLGNLLVLAGHFEEAEDSYRRAIEIDPEDADSHYNLALVLIEQGRTKEAQKSLRSVLELDPSNAWAHYQMGTLYAGQRNRNKAVQHYSEAFSIDRTLASPEVNSHIVENHFATEALLKVYVEEAPSVEAPRAYKEPARVADLLLPEQPVEPSEEPGPETAPESAAAAESAAPTTSGRRRADTAPAVPDEGDEPIQGDEDAVSPTDQERLSTAPSPRSDMEDDTELSAPEIRTIDSDSLRTRPSGQTESSRPVGDTTSTPAAIPMTQSEDRSTFGDDSPSGSRSYIPGVQSTGRLDIELLPAVDAAPAVSPS